MEYHLDVCTHTALGCCADTGTHLIEEQRDLFGQKHTDAKVAIKL